MFLNKIIQEPFVPGDYSCSVSTLIIRSQRDTTAKQLGTYFKDQHFVVFQVYPEENGIVWGRVSSATSSGYGRYIGMRVNNNIKVSLERAWEDQTPQDDAVSTLARIAVAVEKIANK